MLSINAAIGLRQIHQPFVARGDRIEEAFELKMKMIELRRETRVASLTLPRNINFCSAKFVRRIRIISYRKLFFDRLYHISWREERLEDEERKETSDLCSPNSRVVFQSLFPIRGVINILMRLPFGRVAGKRTEISSAKSRSQ